MWPVANCPNVPIIPSCHAIFTENHSD
jgi:hypothetical protein